MSSIRDRMQDWDPEVRDSTPEEKKAVEEGSAEAHPRPTGRELFDSYSKAEQDKMLGPEIAQAVRDGKVKFEDLVVEVPLEAEQNYIRQATVNDLGLKEDK